MNTGERIEATCSIENIVNQLGKWDTEKSERTFKAVAQALRKRLLFEEAIFIFEQLPMELKVIYADGWKVKKHEIFEEARFNDIYDLIEEVKKADYPFASVDFSTFTVAIKAIKSVFLILYEHIPLPAMKYILGFLPDDFQHLMFELHEKQSVGYNSIEYKNIRFVLESGKDKEKKHMFLKKLAEVLGFPENIEKAEDLFKEFLHSIRDSISFEDSVKMMKEMPVYIKYFYVDNWKTITYPSLERDEDYNLPGLFLLNNLSKTLQFCEQKEPVEEIINLFHVLSGLLLEGERFRLKIFLQNHFRKYEFEDQTAFFWIKRKS